MLKVFNLLFDCTNMFYNCNDIICTINAIKGQSNYFQMKHYVVEDNYLR